MDFSTTQETQTLSHQLQAFMDQYVLPYNPAWHHAVATGRFVEPLLARIASP
jgi:acyl-CoA dehydrogenase